LSFHWAVVCCILLKMARYGGFLNYPIQETKKSKRKHSTTPKFGNLYDSIGDDDIFSVYPPELINEMITKSFMKEYPNMLTTEGRYQFSVPSSDENGIDLGSCFVEVDLEVRKEDGSPLTTEDNGKIQPTNDFFDALFAKVSIEDMNMTFLFTVIANFQIELNVNGRQLDNDTKCCHPQVAFLNNLLGNNIIYQDAVLNHTNIWFKDYKYPAIPSIRHDYIAGSKRLKLYGRLNYNLFTAKRYLLPNVNISIDMTGNSSEYCLIRTKGITDKYKVVIHSCKLNVRHVNYRETFRNKVEKHLSAGGIARYPYTRTTLDTFQIPKGVTVWRSPTFGLGKWPKRAYFAICESEAVFGKSWEANPMIFPASEYKLNYVQFYNNGDPLLLNAYEPDFENKNCNKSYMSLVQTVRDSRKTDCEPSISCRDFVGQYGIFGIDSLPNNGVITIETHFKDEIPRGLNGLLFVQYETCFTIDKCGNISGI